MSTTKFRDEDWDAETCLKLIKEFEKETVLWSVDHPDYYDAFAKEKAWQNLSSIFDKAEHEIRRKIDILRSSYRRERNRELRTSKEHPNNPYKSQWFAYEAFDFLRDIYDHKQIRPYIIRKKAIVNNKTPRISLDSIKVKKRVLSSSPPKKAFEIDTSPVDKLTPLKKVDISNDISCSSTDNNKEHSNISKIELKKDECTVFGELVATKLRKFNERDQFHVMHSINEVIFQHELNLYSHNSVPSNNVHTNQSADQSSVLDERINNIIYYTTEATPTGIVDQDSLQTIAAATS